MAQRKRFTFAFITLICGVLYMTAAASLYAGDGKAGRQNVGNIYRLALHRDNITLDISGSKCYRDDLKDKYQRFREESRRLKSEDHQVTEIRDMVVRKLNQYDQFFATTRITGKDNIPLKMQVVFSPVPEGKLLAISSRMTLYVAGNPVQVGKGKAYTTAPYSVGSPFVYSIKTALDDFNPQPFSQELERNKKYLKAIILTPKVFPPGPNRQKLYLRLMEKIDRLKELMEQHLKIDLQTVNGEGDDVKKIALAILAKQVKKEDIEKLKKHFEQTTANLLKLYNGECLILDSGSKIDHSISKVTLTLPDGETGTYNVEKHGNLSSGRTIRLECQKKGSTYLLKPHSKYLTEIKLIGLDWAIQRYEKQKRIIAR